MILRDFQRGVIDELDKYLVDLAEQKAGWDTVQNKKYAADYAAMAWENVGKDKTSYGEVRNSLGEPLANLWFKVPTGGGKTLLACHAIGSIQQLFLRRRTGLVVWVVPSTQIYRQTLKSLADKQHPYRQQLELQSAGRVMVVEKTDKFTLADVETHLVVLIVMSQSVMTKNKEGRKVFRDNTGYTSFFPAEDAYAAHEKLLSEFPNLEYFDAAIGVGGRVAKTSLGNVLRISRPVIIVDEGHKNRSLLARDTLLGFNPVFMLELSATPPEQINGRPVNIIARVSGKQVHAEEMIKLDLNVTNKHSAQHWHDTVIAAKQRREELEAAAVEYRQNTDIYIRPIMLVQVERTGKDQRDSQYIHAEEVREYLHKTLGIPEREIAIKSSESDELVEHTDLLAEDCPLRYIITKQALQEGWDCPFAYVLTTLGTNKSESSLTQLVGRVLRQPYAAKTGVKLLDESYVYAYQQDTHKLVDSIKANLEGEGLGDIYGFVNFSDMPGANNEHLEEVESPVRTEFKNSVENVYLPLFAVCKDGTWQALNYEADILSSIDYTRIEVSSLGNLSLGTKEIDDDTYLVGYGESGNDIRSLFGSEITFDSTVEPTDLTRYIVDIVPNPWLAYTLVKRGYDAISAHNDDEQVAGNVAFILSELKKLIRTEIDRLAKEYFENGLSNGVIKFYMIKNSSTRLNQPAKVLLGGGQLERKIHFDKTLHEVETTQGNNLEHATMVYFDDQESILWWYRNIARAQYGVQGWRSHSVYPDFVAATGEDGQLDTVYLVETKGDQLVGNLDTNYKQALFDICNQYGHAVETGELFTYPAKVRFELVKQSSWEKQLREIFI